MGANKQTYINHENDSRERPRKPAPERYAAFFKVDLEWLLTGAGQPTSNRKSVVSIVGYVGAGSEAHFYQEGQGTGEEAPMPPEAGANTVAVIVRGDSMPGIADEGDLVYYEDRREPPTDDLIGRLCVVGLGDGRVLVKRLYPDRDPGKFSLYSANSGPMLGVSVAWAARVTWIRPR